VAVAAVTVAVVTIIAVAVAGFKWPVPTHRPIFSIRDLKSKLEARVASVFGQIENRYNEAERRP
jgi:hypothetical protein